MLRILQQLMLRLPRTSLAWLSIGLGAGGLLGFWVGVTL